MEYVGKTTLVLVLSDGHLLFENFTNLFKYGWQVYYEWGIDGMPILR